MAISYPLPADSFIALLRVQAVIPFLQFQQELAPQASGGVIAKDLGPALWFADVQTYGMKASLFDEVEAAIESLQGSIGTFYLYDTRKCNPKSDPKGTILGSTPVHIQSATNTSLSLRDLPAGYVISRGDRLSFDYGSANNTRAYHRALETVTADGTGATPVFSVSPQVRDAPNLSSLPVTLKRPEVMMRIVPNTHAISPGSLSTVQFQAQQVIL